MRKIIYIVAAITLVAALGLAGAGCGTGVDAKTGTIEVRVTDAPPGYEIISIMVTVSEVKVHKAGDNGGDDGWEILTITDGSFNLLDLDGQELTLATGEVAAGTYTQLRMTVFTVLVTYSYLEEDETVPTIVEATATVPSGELKFVRPFVLEAGTTIILVLDFDAAESVVVTEAGEDGKVIFKPVVKLEIQQSVPSIDSPIFGYSKSLMSPAFKFSEAGLVFNPYLDKLGVCRV